MYGFFSFLLRWFSLSLFFVFFFSLHSLGLSVLPSTTTSPAPSPSPSSLQVTLSDTGLPTIFPESEANLCRCLCGRSAGTEVRVLVPAATGCRECTPGLCIRRFPNACGGPADPNEDGSVEDPVPSPSAGEVSVHCIDRIESWNKWTVLSFLGATAGLLGLAALRSLSPRLFHHRDLGGPGREGNLLF
ncbi:transmembrane protein [Cystoisospora suis]|uniref:Transmembrane protein n=1 Tax=Cystoisospora suis TaxID=483139 RepID=A0A2C6KMJ2_9APIC|nr:transmembrane protein [Cystoisospora suis]